MDEKPCLTTNVEAAAIALGVGRNQLYAAVKKGEFPSIKIGRRRLISVSVLERIIKEGRNPPSSSKVE